MALPLSRLDVSPDSNFLSFLFGQTEERQRRSKMHCYTLPLLLRFHILIDTCVFHVFNMSLRVLSFGSIFCSYQIRFRIGKIPSFTLVRLQQYQLWFV
ncbi:hypothetical protein PAEAM_40600 [Paenibacillus sp. GM1FR]|nr:hypothetical protein PAEAM_40600 [Paenibacillus sp. GM1FR]